VFTRGWEEWVFLVEGDCENSRGFRELRGRVVQGVHLEKGGGDDVDTFFWTDPWLDEIPLRERFRRLFVWNERNQRLFRNS
jgi:hypothetical protein